MAKILLTVSIKVSPFLREDEAAEKLTMSADKRFSANSKERRVRVEFSKNNLLILTSTAKDLKNFDKSLINSLLEQAEKKLQDNNSTDKEKYIVSYQIDTLKEINR